MDLSTTARSLIPSIVLAASLAAATPVRADTIFLKDGSQIPNCKVKSESDSHVSVQTPGGDMVVPRTEIYRILKTKTVYDTFKEQRAALREGDANGLFKLALWARGAEGLRKESDELLEQVISLKENHAEARRLLGHVKLEGEWVVPKPLTINLKASGPTTSDLRSDLGLFLQMRKDFLLAPEAEPPAEENDPLDACTLGAGVIITRKAAGTFYGVTIGQPTLGATIRFDAHSPWIGKTPIKTAAEGQVPGNGSDTSLAIHNAFGSSGAQIHRFLDQLTELRRKKIEEEHSKKKRAKKAP